MDKKYYGPETEFNIGKAPKKRKWTFRDFFLIFKRIAFLPFNFWLKIAERF